MAAVGGSRDRHCGRVAGTHEEAGGDRLCRKVRRDPSRPIAGLSEDCGPSRINTVHLGGTGLLACSSLCYKCVVSYYERHLSIIPDRHWFAPEPTGALRPSKPPREAAELFLSETEPDSPRVVSGTR